MSATAQTDELSQLLKKHNVNQAIIIDDAFDLTCAKAVTKEAIAKFAATVGSDKDIAEELKSLGIDFAPVTRADEQALKALVAKRACLVKARPAVEELLLPYFEQIDPLDELRQHLDALKIPTTPFGVAKALPGDLKADIAFIDYYLEQEPPVPTDLNYKTDYGKKAREQAQAVYQQTRAHIVLMSNRSEVKNHVTEFRQRAKLLKGYFRFAPKEDLANGEQLKALLAALPLSADFRHNLHDFIDALDAQSEQVKSEFMSSVRDLGLEDYAQIRQLSLNIENRPFGDYILRMFGAYLTSLVLENMKIVKTVSELDKTSFEALLPLQDDPSQTLGRIYLASLTERVREPMTRQSPPPSVVVGEAQKGQTEADEPPIAADSQQEATSTVDRTITAPSSSPAPPTPEPVEFGDLLVKDVNSPVYAVVNPACDLVFRKKGRQPKDTLLLLPGDLRHLHEPPKGERSPSLITPLYLHTDKNVYRIDWDYRRLTTVPHDELREKYLVQGYRCDRRLQLGPALELQQHFTSASSRVGLPVPPPIGRSIDFSVYCRGKDGRWCSITPPGSPIKGGCFVYHMRDRDQFVVTNSARDDVLKQITTHCLELGKTGAEVGWDGGSTREQYKGNLNKAVQKWATGFPFHRALGDLPGSRSRKEKECEAKDRMGVAVGTTYAKSVKADIDVLLCLDIGPMPIRPFEGDLAMEMDQL